MRWGREGLPGLRSSTNSSPSSTTARSAGGSVPRVCASISSSTGFLLAALAMRAGLAGEDVDLDEAMMTAINVVTIGIAGTAFASRRTFARGR